MLSTDFNTHQVIYTPDNHSIRRHVLRPIKACFNFPVKLLQSEFTCLTRSHHHLILLSSDAKVEIKLSCFLSSRPCNELVLSCVNMSPWF